VAPSSEWHFVNPGSILTQETHKNPCDLDLWPLTLIFNRVLEVVKVHDRAKFYQAKFSDSWVVVSTEKKKLREDAENNTAVAAAGSTICSTFCTVDSPALMTFIECSWRDVGDVTMLLSRVRRSATTQLMQLLLLLLLLCIGCCCTVSTLVAPRRAPTAPMQLRHVRPDVTDVFHGAVVVPIVPPRRVPAGVTRGFRHVQRVRPNRGPTTRAPRGQRVSDNSAAFPGLWWLLYGVLRHLKVHSVQHDILWPWGGGRECSVRRIAKSDLYKVTYLFISWT